MPRPRRADARAARKRTEPVAARRDRHRPPEASSSRALYMMKLIFDFIKYMRLLWSPMSRLRIVPLDDTVVFPGMPVTVSVDVGSDERVLLVARQQSTYAKVGVVAEVSERVRLAGRKLAV